MFNTYQFCKKVARQEYMNIDFSDLADMYQETHDDSIVATVYIRVYGLAKRGLEKFYSLNSEDKAELILEKIRACLETYTKQKKAKFTTYFYSTINRKAQDIIAKETDHQGNYRDMFFVCSSLDALQEKGYDASIEAEFEETEILKGKKLRDSEIRFCHLVMSNPHKMTTTEIAQELGMSRQGVINLKKRLAEIFRDDYQKV